MAEVHYPIPDHRQAAHAPADPIDLPATDGCAREVLTLPLFPEMRDDEVETVAQAVLKAVRL